MKLQIYLSDLHDNVDVLAGDEAFLRMLARGSVQWLDEELEANLCHRFGIAKQQDWPLAALARIGTELPVDDAYWLLASPVNLLLQRDSFLLNQPVPLALAPNENETLRRDLNQHFARDGLEFLSGANGHWYLRLASAPALVTTLASTVAGRDVASWLPQGHDAQRWRQLLNEIQMLLFNHAVNQEREARGEAAVNSVWLHGGGVSPLGGKALSNVVYADDASLQGMALLTGTPLALFSGLDELIAKKHASALVQVPFQTLGAGWGDQLWGALKTGKIRQLELFLAWHGRILHVQVRPVDLWKFWRKPKTIEAYF